MNVLSLRQTCCWIGADRAVCPHYGARRWCRSAMRRHALGVAVAPVVCSKLFLGAPTAEPPTIPRGDRPRAATRCSGVLRIAIAPGPVPGRSNTSGFCSRRGEFPAINAVGAGPPNRAGASRQLPKEVAPFKIRRGLLLLLLGPFSARKKSKITLGRRPDAFCFSNFPAFRPIMSSRTGTEIESGRRWRPRHSPGPAKIPFSRLVLAGRRPAGCLPGIPDRLLVDRSGHLLHCGIPGGDDTGGGFDRIEPTALGQMC